MGLNGNRLELSFTEDGEPAQEIMGILEALAKRRKYFRLKDGSFLDLSDMDEWQELADSVYEAATLEGIDKVCPNGDTISLRSYRTCYLNSLLENCHLPVEVERSVQDTIAALSAPEEGHSAAAGADPAPLSAARLSLAEDAGSAAHGRYSGGRHGLGQDGTGDRAAVGRASGEGAQRIASGCAHVAGIQLAQRAEPFCAGAVGDGAGRLQRTALQTRFAT